MLFYKGYRCWHTYIEEVKDVLLEYHNLNESKSKHIWNIIIILHLILTYMSLNYSSLFTFIISNQIIFNSIMCSPAGSTWRWSCK